MKRRSLTRKQRTEIFLTKCGEDNKLRCDLGRDEIQSQRTGYMVEREGFNGEEKVRNWKNKKEMKEYKKKIKRSSLG